jgi:hypothetical protein
MKSQFVKEDDYDAAYAKFEVEQKAWLAERTKQNQAKYAQDIPPSQQPGIKMQSGPGVPINVIAPDIRRSLGVNGGKKRRTQKGGLLGFGPAKNEYETKTKLHASTKLVTLAIVAMSQGFPHAEYWGMTFFGAFRLLGMKNPGYTGHIFVGRVFALCISYEYKTSNPTDVATPDAIDDTKFGTAGTAVAAGGGRTRRKSLPKTRKHRKGRRVSRRKHRRSHTSRH